MANYINPFTDIGFKRIFGQEFSKPLLIDFLNNLLIGEKRIVNLKFLDKEQPPVFVDDRSLIYDIYCELDDNEKIIVEMQCINASSPISNEGASTTSQKPSLGKERKDRNGSTTSRVSI